jgi:hypothetical protein
LVAILPARKRGLFLAEAVSLPFTAKKRTYFMADAILNFWLIVDSSAGIPTKISENGPWNQGF